MSLEPSMRPSFGWPNVFSSEGHGPAIEDVWPSLYIGAERLEEIRRKAESLPWAKEAVALWQQEAESVLEEEPHFVPGTPGGRAAMHRAGHGQHVLFDPARRDHIWDPIMLETIQPDDNMQRSLVTLSHERIRRLMVSLAFLYGLTGDERYARWVWQGLQHSVELYDKPPGFDTEPTYTVVYGGLYEAQSMLHLLQALHLVQGAPGGREDDVRRINDVIFRKVGTMLAAWMDVMPVHNMSSWGMAALAILGQHLDLKEWTKKALHSERNGLRRQITHGMPRSEKTGNPDGLWFETSTFYNFYAGIPLITLYRAGEEAGLVDDDLRERFHTFFEAPFHLSDENLCLLCLSDRVAPGRFNLTQMRHVYEYAAGQVDADLFGPILSLLYKSSGARRTSLAALAWGLDELPPPCDPPGKSVIFDAARLVTFRKQTERGDVTLWFLGGEDGHPYEGHHHHDKLSFSLHAYGEIITSDLGRQSGIDRGPWSTFLSGTLSHNTLMVDEVDQGPMKSLRFDADLDAPVPRVRSAVSTDPYTDREDVMDALLSRSHRVKKGVYEGVTLDRSLFFDVPYIVFADECTAQEDKRFGVIFHAYGSLVAQAMQTAEDAPLNLPPLPEDGYYELFTGRTSADPVRCLVADWRLRADLWVRLITVSEGLFEATWGNTPANPSSTRRGTVLLRTSGHDCRFLSVLELHDGTPTLCGIEAETDRAIRTTQYGGETRSYALVT